MERYSYLFLNNYPLSPKKLPVALWGLGVRSWARWASSLPFGSYISPGHTVLFCWLQACLPSSAFWLLGVWCFLSLFAVWLSNESKQKSTRGIFFFLSLFNHQQKLDWMRARERAELQWCSLIPASQCSLGGWPSKRPHPEAAVHVGRDRIEGAQISGRACMEGERKWKGSPASLTKPRASSGNYGD